MIMKDSDAVCAAAIPYIEVMFSHKLHHCSLPGYHTNHETMI